MNQNTISGKAVHGIELRTGKPYAQLISSHQGFAHSVAAHFQVPADAVIPTYGATGAIEAIRNHIYRFVQRPSPVLLTVRPGYWRAKEAFEGFGYDVHALPTKNHGFEIDEDLFNEKTAEIKPDLIYLSLPNNPTGAIFDPGKIIRKTPETTSILFDLTVPTSQLDTHMLTRNLYHTFQERPGLFAIGSLSKSHNTAEYRVGWAVCANSGDALRLRQENRNVLSSVSVEAVMQMLGRPSPVVGKIHRSFEILESGEKSGHFTVIKPPLRVESSYVLVKTGPGVSRVRETLDHYGIKVMWGSEFGLTDEYLRLEVSEPENTMAFVAALKDGIA